MRDPVRLIFAVLGLCAFCAGCASSAKAVKNNGAETSAEELSAGRSVVGAVAGQPVSEEELRRLAVEMKKDPQTQEAVRAITEGMTGANVNVKYCPVDGKRFSESLEKCPEHDTLLKRVDE